MIELTAVMTAASTMTLESTVAANKAVKRDANVQLPTPHVLP